MSKERREKRHVIAVHAAARLCAGETATDAAIHELGLLCADLPKMRQEAQLSAVVGQSVFLAMARAYSALVEARGHLVDAHSGFDVLRGDLNLPLISSPGVDKPPGFARAPLAAVA